MEKLRPTREDAARMYAALCRKSRSIGTPDTATLHDLGRLIDLAGDLKREWGLTTAIDACALLLSHTSDGHSCGTLHYFMANAWSSLGSVRRKRARESGQPQLVWEEPEGVEEIAQLRAAEAALPCEPEAAFLRCQVLTNLGNALKRRGRFIEALECWDAALRINPEFGMAHGNRGMALEWYSMMAYDPGHQAWLIREAHAALARAEVSPDTYPDARIAFEGLRRRIESRVKPAVLTRPSPVWLSDRTWSEQERNYREWSARERLFLNDLNDVDAGLLAMADVLMLPDHVTRIDEGPALLGFFNNLKQEYIAARLFLYEGLHTNGVHFADRDVTLLNTLDYPAYSIGAERVKLAYRSLYSLLDKLAFFLNDYLLLGIPERKVFFRTIWYERCEPKRGLRTILGVRQNAPLRALFWLAQDFFEPGERASDLGALRMAEMRQELEHKYLKLHEMGPSTSGRTDQPGAISHDRLAHSINRREFEERTLRLARLVRAAIVYLVFAVRIEEKDRLSARPVGTINLLVPSDRWEDDWKR